VAVQNGDVESQLLARVLLAHARAEEQLFYPAAILVGEIVRVRTEAPARLTGTRGPTPTGDAEP
jgi:hypothetical protein